MDIYILYKSGFYSIDPNKTVLGIYRLISCGGKHIFEFFGETGSPAVEKIGGYKSIVLSRFKHSEVKNPGIFTAYLEIE